VFANNRNYGTIFRWSTIALSAFLGTSCGGALPDPDKASISMAPKSMPTRNMTGFTEALRCMDDLFLEHRKKGFTLTSSNMDDSTGKLKLGVKDMLLTAISTMSATSGAVKYIDMDQTSGEDSVNYLTNMLMSQNKFTGEWPLAYIRGSISQVDDSVMSGKQGGAITTGIIDIGASQDRSVSSVTMDMLLMDMASRTNIPGIHASNMLAVSRSGKGADAGASGGKIVKAGIQFNVSKDSTESSGQAVRTLVQLGLIELVGKWTKVPYWTCLEIEGNNPAFRSQLREWYDKTPRPDLVRFIQAGLMGSGHYQGDINGQENEGLRSGIAKYQTDRSLVPNGNVSFEVYESLMLGKVNLSSMPAEPPKAAVTVAPTSPIDVRLVATNEKTGVGYKVGDDMKLSLSISRNGYPYCYYRDAGGVIAQIYPNRFQPDKQAQGNQPIAIPPVAETAEQARFTLTFEKAGSEEEVMCLASDADISSLLPKEWQVKELTPMKARSLEEIEKTMSDRAMKATASRLGVQHIKFKVR